MRVLPKSGRRAIPGAALGAGLAVLAGWLGMAAPVLGGDSREEFFPPRTGGYDWNALAMRAATRSGEAQALLLETQAERRQAEVDTAWREPQLRLGAAQGEADEETEGRLAVRTDPASARTEPDLRPREWETIDSDAYEIGVRVYLVSPFVNQWLRRRGEAAALAKEAESREAAYAVYCEVRSLCLEAAILQEEIARLEQVERYRVEIRDIRSRQAAAAVAGALDLIQAVTRVADLRAGVQDSRLPCDGCKYRELAHDLGHGHSHEHTHAPAPATDAVVHLHQHDHGHSHAPAHGEHHPHSHGMLTA